MRKILHFEELDSTNSYLKMHYAQLASGTVVRADRQTAGRGRYDRIWVSRNGGLYFSVLLKTEFSLYAANLTQLMALSVCRALEQYHVPARLKWPNDVLVERKKICGILSEGVLEKNVLKAVVVGVGINVEQEGLTAVGQPATSLKECGVHADKTALLGQVLDLFEPRVQDVCKKGFSILREEYKARFEALGQTVKVKDGENTICGIARDVSPDGTLLVQTGKELKEIYIGDVTHE